MFSDISQLLYHNPEQLNYGIAVSDIDDDGEFELIIAGFGFPNLVLKWDGVSFRNVASTALADPQRQAIGVAACDIDGDGQEEIYILNTDTFAGQKRFSDRLLDCVDGEWTDLFTLGSNKHVLNLTAGRSVIAVDRRGTGNYGFFVANYGGPLRLYELDEDGYLHNSAPDAGLALVTGGRSAVALPLVTDGMDIFAGNEGGANFLFCNRGDGTFEEMAKELGLNDSAQNARGVAVLDANEDGLFDLVCGNWEGPHRLFIHQPNGRFEDVAPAEMASPSRVRTVIAADFDNDGYEEIFFNNIGQPNRLFGRRSGRWQMIEIGDALEPFGLGTGAAVGDFDHDGRLELLIAHGESETQPLTLYSSPNTFNHWLRVLPLTAYGAPARGAIVVLEMAGRTQRRAIDAGSGYLCQMEPVAHFGLGGQTQINRVRVHWPDGATAMVNNPVCDQMLRVAHP
ncbi:MAG: CRTAC1 family protein [Chloroflexi bacterium]|nr:CRTAC1 family protein [Chloroflexota bacterium]